jgi:hypothetical protein
MLCTSTASACRPVRDVGQQVRPGVLVAAQHVWASRPALHVVCSTTEGRKQRGLHRVSSTPNRLHVDGNSVTGRILASRIALGALIDQLPQRDAAQEPVDLIAEFGP